VPVHGAGALLRADLLDGADQKEWAAARPRLLGLDSMFVHSRSNLLSVVLKLELSDYHERKRLATDLRAKSFV
jgi:hypothetical protein